MAEHRANGIGLLHAIGPFTSGQSKEELKRHSAGSRQAALAIVSVSTATCLMPHLPHADGL